MEPRCTRSPPEIYQPSPVPAERARDQGLDGAGCCDVVQVPTTGDRVERRGWKIGSGGATGSSRPNGTRTCTSAAGMGCSIADEISGDRYGPKAHEIRPKMVEIMTCLLMGKHFWIALVLATLLHKIVIAPLRIRRSAPHRSASLRTDLRRIASHRSTRYRQDIHRLRSQDIHLKPSHHGEGSRTTCCSRR